MKTKLIFGLLLALTISSPAVAQSALQTATFIINGGSVDVEDLTEVRSQIGIPKPYEQHYFYFKDEEKCIVGWRHLINDEFYRDNTFYLNNIILEETKTQETNGRVQFIFTGKDHVQCQKVREQPEVCGRTWWLHVPPLHAARVHKAIQYLYGGFCTSAKRKNAF